MSWHSLPVAAIGDVLSQDLWSPLADNTTVLGIPPCSSVAASNSANLQITSGANRSILFDMVLVDQDPTGQSIWDPGNYQFVCRTAGWYRGALHVGWTANTFGGHLQTGWEHNGVQFAQTDRINVNEQDAYPCRLPPTFLSVDDTLHPFAWWTPASGGPFSIALSNQAQTPACFLRLLSL